MAPLAALAPEVGCLGEDRSIGSIWKCWLGSQGEVRDTNRILSFCLWLQFLVLKLAFIVGRKCVEVNIGKLFLLSV